MIIKEYDAVIIGSGFGGTMTAKKLAEAGWKVAIIERGDWVSRGAHNWEPNGSIDLTKNYDKSIPYHVIKGGNKKHMGVYAAVGGPSVFYGGVSFRFREKDFYPPDDLVADSNAAWPINYQDLEKYYDEAEKVLNIAGEAGIDPTEPHRQYNFPQQPMPFAAITKKIKGSAESLGLHPFALPLAINGTICKQCTTCDTFACAISAKNDLATQYLDFACKNYLIDLFPNTIAFKVNIEKNKAKSIWCENLVTKEQLEIHGKVIIVAAGALASPHLILNSQLEKMNPAGHLIGKYLMRHVNSIVFGIFPSAPDQEARFHKEIAIMDYYFGHKNIAYPQDKIGSLQQVPTPPGALVANAVPFPFGNLLAKGVKLITGLLAIAEDQPQLNNFIAIDHTQPNGNRLAKAVVSHEYSKRDFAAINALTNEAKKLMKKSGAWFNYVHAIRTFSHSAGTIRMGLDENTSPLDKNCNFRGIDNMYVVDACFMPTSAAVNPSLTIAANALRVGDFLINNNKK